MSRADYHCQLCGVSFHISRIRTRHEPRAAAFFRGPGGWVPGRNFVADEELDDEDPDADPEPESCSSKTGCCMVKRETEFGMLYPDPPLLPDDDAEDGMRENDPDFEYRSDLDDEILEYDSDAGDPLDDDDEDEDDANIVQASDNSEEWRFKVWGPDYPEYDTEFVPLSTRLSTPLSYQVGPNTFCTNQKAEHERRCYEHIAGADCRSQKGYHGTQISPEEMRGCHTVQCIIPRDNVWEPLPDDLNFEWGSQYHLTGVAAEMNDWLRVAPCRHGVDRLEVESDYFPSNSPEELSGLGLPFHPTCFEIFIQVSKRYLGHVDMDSLVKIRDKASLRYRRIPVKHHPHVLAGKEQYWVHNRGHEYLAANPIFIPALRPILKAAICNGPEFCVDGGTLSRDAFPDSAAATDPFLRFPAEILQIITDKLDARDIARLQRASYAFARLPVSLWHKLILKDMPWLYEAWSSDTTPYHWATVIAQDAMEEKNAFEKWHREWVRQCETVQQHMPDAYEAWLENRPGWQWPEHPERRELLKLSPVKLPYQKTDWHRLYWDISTNWDQLKGLQNRARIWDAVLQIVDLIREEREGMGL
ncbi:uncharacterized protein BJX67DRAFT_199286 [Aspergillus lucknowensis]|uniref:F-box domain-containing protein n=1 Tax=Aspergillus lucknowensis TaxID=176173 RepID=A0ABR4LL03_9EURO